ncbi:MAG: GNAT family N-acetyltransferase [Gemmatimonadota bacterium]
MAQLPIELVDNRGRAFRVRELELPADRARLAALYRTFEPKRAAQGLPPEDDGAIRRWLDRILDTGVHLVVEVDGGLCGHVMLMPMEHEGETELANFLHQSMRGRGIGSALNKLAVARARENGCRRVWLSVEPSNIPAIRSYASAGFRTLDYSLWAPEIEMEIRF